jgi:hypothetical protein
MNAGPRRESALRKCTARRSTVDWRAYTRAPTKPSSASTRAERALRAKGRQRKNRQNAAGSYSRTTSPSPSTPARFAACAAHLRSIRSGERRPLAFEGQRKRLTDPPGKRSGLRRGALSSRLPAGRAGSLILLPERAERFLHRGREEKLVHQREARGGAGRGRGRWGCCICRG